MGRPPLSEREPYDLDSLTDVALGVFVEKGFDATGIADIATAAGISKASIYHHTRSKDGLLERGVNRAIDALFALLNDPQARKGRAIDCVRYVLRNAVAIQVKHLREVTVLVRLRGNTEVERIALARRQEFDAWMTSMVRRAQRDGDVRKDIDALLISRLTQGSLNSLTEWYQPDGRIGWTEVADALVEAFDGLAVAHPDVAKPSGGK